MVTPWDVAQAAKAVEEADKAYETAQERLGWADNARTSTRQNLSEVTAAYAAENPAPVAETVG
jgi:hypothetical protein